MDTASDNGSEPRIFLSYADNFPEHVVLFIHGYPLSSQMWVPQLEGLAGTVWGIAPDLRGCGESGTPGGAVTMTDYAEDCVALLDELGLEDPVVVCGLSMGGYVALELFRLHPDRVSALVLAATKAGADTDEGKAGRDKNAQIARDDGVEAIASAILPKMFAPQTVADDPELVAEVREIMTSGSVEGVVGALEAMRDRIDSTPTLAKIGVPTLVLHGADDQLMPPAEGEKLKAGIPGAELVLIEGAGHLLNLEQPDLFNDALLDFLSTLP
ncbi:MAG: alpha/beta fold hydrolase [Ardenticatenales bacterium]|jgi:pimeloyl-ACP methyl ester carboxylesterase|nr:alpha/beta fold hydrolase [Ardenticatenales bacterium]